MTDRKSSLGGDLTVSRKWVGSQAVKAQRRQLETVAAKPAGAHFLRPHLALAPHQLLR